MPPKLSQIFRDPGFEGLPDDEIPVSSGLGRFPCEQRLANVDVDRDPELSELYEKIMGLMKSGDSSSVANDNM